MDILAFLPAAIAAVVRKPDTAEPPKLPTFEPRWWHKPGRLDARPVMWSLRNRPDEWEPADRPPVWLLRHKPSGHVFHIGAYRSAHLTGVNDQ